MSRVADELVFRVGRRIGELRRQCGLTQSDLGEQLGIAQKNVHRLESGTQNLTLRTIVKVAEALDVDLDDLWQPEPGGLRFLQPGRVALASESQLPPRPVPVFAIAAAAGFAKSGQLAHVQGWALVDQPVDERHFVVRVEGDSMTPTIAPGAWCLFRRTTTPPTNGAVVLAQLDGDSEGGRYLVKRLLRLQVGADGMRVTLGSDNPRYEPFEVEVASDDELSLLAEFVEVVDNPSHEAKPKRRSGTTRTAPTKKKKAAAPRRRPGRPA